MRTLLAAVLLLGGAAQATEPLPQSRVVYSSATFARINPLGLISSNQLGWRLRLMDRGADDLLFGDTYLHLGATARISPAFAQGGLRVEVSPIALFRAWASVEGAQYFGTFDQITGFVRPSPVYDEDTLSELGRGEPTAGWIFSAGGVLQAKAGPIALRSTFQATRYDLDLPGDQAYFYDQITDRLAPDEAFLVTNDLDAMFVGDKLRLGARWTWTDGQGPEGSLAAMAHHRVGPLFAWQFSDAPVGARFDQPTLFVLAQWWLVHPYRDGTEQPAGLPLIALGFSFRGDVLP